jgi:hypothetical protein
MPANVNSKSFTLNIDIYNQMCSPEQGSACSSRLKEIGLNHYIRALLLLLNNNFTLLNADINYKNAQNEHSEQG